MSRLPARSRLAGWIVPGAPVNGGYWIAAVLAIVLHELAHVLLATVCGLRVKRVGIGWIGPYIVRERGTATVNACVAFAGPVANLALAFAFWQTAPLFAQVNLILGAYNALPFIPRTDGRHAWDAIRAATGR